jgi:excisionase family DNA binding protein
MVIGMATMTARISDRTTVLQPRERLTRADVMTATEVSQLLCLPLSTVYHLARSGQLPATRLGRTWRFLRPRIEELLGA